MPEAVCLCSRREGRSLILHVVDIGLHATVIYHEREGCFYAVRLQTNRTDVLDKNLAMTFPQSQHCVKIFDEVFGLCVNIQSATPAIR